MKTTREYIKTDRNGTKYWNVTDICSRCGGSGIYFTFGTCFKCGGSGVESYVFKEYTPEHEAKLEENRKKSQAKRLEKAEEMEQERRKINMKNAGFGEDGVAYIHYGNTYNVKETLKRGGAHWDSTFRAWVAPNKIIVDGVKVLEIDAKDVCNEYGCIDWEKANEIKEKMN